MLRHNHPIFTYTTLVMFKCKFFFPGEYAGFDEEQPTSMSGGKKTVAEKLKNHYGYKTLVAIGDGATDMEAFPPAVRVKS